MAKRGKPIQRKTEEELKKLTLPRLKKYHKSLQERVGRMRPRPCDCCGEIIEGLSPDKEDELNDTHKYVMFVKAIMLSRQNMETDWKI